MSPKVISFDFETSGLDTYSDTFRIHSAAFTWEVDGVFKSVFVQSEYDVGLYLERAIDSGAILICHNVQFEMACIKCRYPMLYERFVRAPMYDTLRLVQVFDNGGKVFYEESLVLTIEQMLDAELDDKPKQPKTGLSLTASVERLLPVEFHNHKEEAHAWLRDNKGVKKGKEGGHLMELPADILERYNIGDTENTLRLYTFCLQKFEEQSYTGFLMDHQLYLSSVRLTVDAFIRGIRVQRDALITYREEILLELADIEAKFRVRFKVEIEALEASRAEAYLASYKTTAGLERAKLTATEECRFNLGSNKQLATLFVDKLGMKPKFTTEKGSPSFRSSFLSQWKEGGMILLKRRKRLMVLKQCEAALELSASDGKWHPNVRVAGTRSGRGAAGHAG